MLPRVLRRAAAGTSPCRALSSSSWAQAEVVHSSSAEQEKAELAAHSGLQRSQLEFCCLLCGWDVACKTCPFNWFNFDPRKFRAKQRRGQQGDFRRLAVNDEEFRRAMEMLGIAAESDGFDRPSVSQQQVKDAFRAKALEWHPDCNAQPDAESVFKDILEAYELLLAHAR
jgi:hypothetical protein